MNFGDNHQCGLIGTGDDERHPDRSYERDMRELEYARFAEIFPGVEWDELHVTVKLNKWQSHWLREKAAELNEPEENVLRGLLVMSLESEMDYDPRPLPDKCLACDGTGMWRNVLNGFASQCTSCGGTGKRQSCGPRLPPRVPENETQGQFEIPW